MTCRYAGGVGGFGGTVIDRLPALITSLLHWADDC
jgi:hypothetical protein